MPLSCLALSCAQQLPSTASRPPSRSSWRSGGAAAGRQPLAVPQRPQRCAVAAARRLPPPAALRAVESFNHDFSLDEQQQQKLDELLYSYLFCQQASAVLCCACVPGPQPAFLHAPRWGGCRPSAGLHATATLTLCPTLSCRLCATASCLRAHKWSSRASCFSRCPGKGLQEGTPASSRQRAHCAAAPCVPQQLHVMLKQRRPMRGPASTPNGLLCFAASRAGAPPAARECHRSWRTSSLARRSTHSST